jgi:hypothetical protein
MAVGLIHPVRAVKSERSKEPLVKVVRVPESGADAPRGGDPDQGVAQLEKVGVPTQLRPGQQPPKTKPSIAQVAPTGPQQ